ncbi:MAG: PQQ-binding-like beta-propeller repeat protein [Phycisphaerales bacterium]
MLSRSTNLAAGLALFAGLAAAPASAQTIYFADIFIPTFDDGSIRKVNVDGTGLETVITTGGGLRAIDVDVAGGKVYWTDVNNFKIARCNLDGTGSQDLITAGLIFPAGLRLDLQGSRMFWGDSDEGVSTAGLDGSSPFMVASSVFFRGLALDVPGGSIYWTTSQTASTGRIIKANLDGTNQTIAVQGAGKPTSIAIDPAGGKVYWTDHVLNVVRRANLDGSGMQTLYTDLGGQDPRGIALDLANGKVYWGQDFGEEPTVGAIFRANLDGTDPEFWMTSGLGLVQDMVIVSGGGPPPCYPNCDDSTQAPVLNVADFGCFLTRYAAGEAYANCDDSTQPPVLNVADFGCFLTKYAAGCR